MGGLIDESGLCTACPALPLSDSDNLDGSEAVNQREVALAGTLLIVANVSVNGGCFVVLNQSHLLQAPGRYPAAEEGGGIPSFYGMDAAALAEAGGQMDAQHQVSMLELLGLLRAVRAHGHVLHALPHTLGTWHAGALHNSRLNGSMHDGWHEFTTSECAWELSTVPSALLGRAFLEFCTCLDLWVPQLT